MLQQSNDNSEFIGKYDISGTKEKLKDYLLSNIPLNKKIVILCVGSDRSTGDSLGPLVGSFLVGDNYIVENNIEVYGTLDQPVHSKNINKIIKKIQNENSFIIVIDASLDSVNLVGNIRARRGSVQPNSWVKKNILKIGDLYINMVVNLSGFREFQVLQSTKLSVVLKGADIIAGSLVDSLQQLNIKNKSI